MSWKIEGETMKKEKDNWNDFDEWLDCCPENDDEVE